MTYADVIAQVQQLVALVGPNAYLQAIIIAVLFIIAGKIRGLDHFANHGSVRASIIK